MTESIIIIGAGMGGLAAGIYGQVNGYRTRIFEMHSLPGGQCTSWKRQGYTFDVCIHHLFGCSPDSKIYRLWRELGVMPHFVSAGATMLGALFGNALSGRNAVRTICRRDGKRFRPEA